MIVALPAIAAARSGSDEGAARDSPAAATVVVDLEADPATHPWVALAFQHSIARELSGFERLAPVERDDFRTRDCGSDRSCRVRVYREAHVDIVLFGRVSDDAVAYELYQTWTPARVEVGEIAIGRDQTPIGLKHEIRAAFHAVLKHGGLLDQRPYMYGAQRDAASRWFAVTPALVLGALLAMALPFAVLLLWTRSLRAVARLRSARRAALLAAALVGIAVGSTRADLAAQVAAWPWGFAGLGGLGWGVLLVGWGKRLFPPLGGLARIAHSDVGRIVRTWCLVVAQRVALLVAVYAPLMAGAIRVGDALALPALWTLALIAPGIALFARLWFASWVDCIAAILDDKLVDGAATAANPWSREITDYLMGYVRRTGWDLDPHVLARVVFLPGDGIDGAIAYGGGPTHARIVVDKRLLELVMGELVEIKPAEKPALWPDWTIGTVVPQPSVIARRGTTVATYHGRKPHAASHARARRALGQAATLLGYVMPAPGELVPLISDNPQDLAVVRSLLSEHYAWDAPDPDEEFDATDPTDKDLLFGALVRELGVVEREDCQLETIKLAFGQRLAGIMARPASRIADAYAALNFARHHVVQYLYYLWSGDREQLTQRARADRLADMSQKLLARVRDLPDLSRGSRSRSLRRRLVWLSWFFPDPIIDRREIWLRRALVAGALIAAFAGGGVLIKHSIDYHTTYTERIAGQEQARAAALRKQEQDRKPQEGTNGKAQAHP